MMIFSNEQCIHLLDNLWKWNKLELIQVSGPRIDKLGKQKHRDLDDKRVPHNGKFVQINASDVYVIGGSTQQGGPQKMTYKVNLSRQKVSICAYMTEKRTAMGVCNIGHLIYAIGGFDQLTSCEVYNTFKNRWTLLK